MIDCANEALHGAMRVIPVLWACVTHPTSIKPTQTQQQDETSLKKSRQLKFNSVIRRFGIFTEYKMIR